MAAAAASLLPQSHAACLARPQHISHISTCALSCQLVLSVTLPPPSSLPHTPTTGKFNNASCCPLTFLAPPPAQHSTVAENQHPPMCSSESSPIKEGLKDGYLCVPTGRSPGTGPYSWSPLCPHTLPGSRSSLHFPRFSSLSLSLYPGCISSCPFLIPHTTGLRGRRNLFSS